MPLRNASWTSSLLRPIKGASCEMPLAEHSIVHRTLLLGSCLREGCTSTKRSGQRTVLHLDNADVANSGNGTITSHTSGQLDLDREISSRRSRKTAKTDTGYILSHRRFLESRGVGTS